MNRLIIITGISGSGKSTALNVLEDLGFFCIDNLPLVFIEKLTELADQAAGKFNRIGLVIDIREGDQLADFPAIHARLKEMKHSVEVIFLDASDESLLRRYSETRRLHPLAPQGTVAEGIALERQKLEPLRQLADNIIDTSALSIHQLKEIIRDQIVGPSNDTELTLTIQSFGFKNGVPLTSDMVLDVRFLPNPYYDPAMRNLTGEDANVSQFVLGKPETQRFMEMLLVMLKELLPQYKKEGRRYFTVSIGCTGGKHRSVAIARHIHDALKSMPGNERTRVILKHRDIGGRAG
ncbi:MAG: Nucleotide-binding protein [Myxococcota bacterium]|nr:Nucleotide-binding protein [Myxococcota bacterium]